MIAFGLSLGSLAWGPFSRPALQLPKRKLIRAGMWLELKQEDLLHRFFLEEGREHESVTWSDLGFDVKKPIYSQCWGALTGVGPAPAVVQRPYSTAMSLHYGPGSERNEPDTRLFAIRTL